MVAYLRTIRDFKELAEMKRLTLKDDEYWVKSDNQNKAIQKLGQLEDIEEKLGIDLITLFKAFNGICYKDNEIKFACHLLLTDNWSFIVLDDWITYQKTNFYPSLELNEYGKTWALTKEELEK